jgi:hypothetical protein
VAINDPAPRTIPIDDGDRSGTAQLAWLNEARTYWEVIDSNLAFSFGAGAVGVVKEFSVEALKCIAESPESLRVEVNIGRAVITDEVPNPDLLKTYFLRSQFTSNLLQAPSSDPRIDTVVATLKDFTISIITGDEAASPVAKAAPAGTFLLAWINHTVAETVIKDADDFTNGWIQDKRLFCNA